MARLFILFLIALLPLRGMALDRMVFQMQNTGSTASLAQGADIGMGDDCALHMQAASTAHGVGSDAGGDPDHGTQQHKGCQSCQLCMPVAALSASALAAIKHTPQSVPLLRTTAFASAESARLAKPPIS
jgi:hypothetical protein